MKKIEVTQSEKARIINSVQEVRATIMDVVSRLPAEKRGLIFLGTWSVKDILAHIIGWDYTNIKAAESIQQGRLPDFYSFRDKDWKRYNELLVNQYKAENWDELLNSVTTSLHQLIEYVEQIPVENFFKDYGVRYKGYKVIIARLLEADISDVRIHHRQIESLLD